MTDTVTAVMDRNIAIEAVRVTEAAAIAAWGWTGRGDEMSADAAAVEAMRAALNKLNIDGTVVIGEGERDEAPMLFIGEKVGIGGPKIDIALDPLEGTTLTAKANANAMATLALAPHGGFLNAPDVYMEKIAVGGGLPEGVIDINVSAKENLERVAEAKNVNVEDLLICVLDRPRHQELISDIRNAGARIQQISDGDIYGIIETSQPHSRVDMYLGSGGAPEGVLAAAALQCIGGQMQGKLLFRNDDERERASKMGIDDFDRVYGINDLASGDVIFSATGVTDGGLLRGVQRTTNSAITQSIVMRSMTGTVREITTRHDYTRKSEDKD
ncbi:MAG: Fructose-1,6-bisphosphatase class 2 [Alphaproteobacteria bacterium MarineAlpha12_Bin1]|jgi:fructose-1,6-bisphosphatase II / sedoheptulose-1,7-bisphosphatase|nr:MAG: Fructose-1,6-bisphosphatase class 2 [Alphaproteobacteria bacterium MarineAlpha12_Bin1]|tara:strand:- start:6785 stop:7768 length:984 start_codon:yes stop_codon:yes gene_type:complete